MTLLIPNMNASLVDKNGKVLTPWNSWFQQFTQNAQKVLPVTLTGSPFDYRSNSLGYLYVSGGTISSIVVYRGLDALNFTGSISVPMSIGDIAQIIYSSAPNVRFVPAF